MKTQNTILKKYALFFFLVLFIPLFLVCLFFIINSNRILRERAVNDIETQKNTISRTIHQQFDDLLVAPQRLTANFSNGRFATFNIVLTKSYDLETRQKINAVSILNKFINNIYILSPVQPFVLSSSTNYPFAEFASKITDGAMDNAEYLAFLDSLIDSNEVNVVYQDNSILLYFYKHYYSVGGAYGGYELSHLYYILELDKTQLAKQLISYTAAENLLFVLTIPKADAPGEKEILFRNYPAADQYAALERVLLASNPDGVTAEPFRLNSASGQFLVYSEALNIPGWQIDFMIDENIISHDIQGAQTGLYLIILLVAAVGNVLVFLFTYASYRPVVRLKASLEQLTLHGSADQPFHGNEFQLIEQIARHLHSSNHELAALSRLNILALKQFIILHLTGGRVEQDEQLRAYLSQIDLFTENAYYLVALLYINDHLAQTADVLTFLENCGAAEERTIYAVHGHEKGQIILVILTEDNDIEQYRPCLSQIHRDFTARFAIRAIISAGLIYPELSRLAVSYRQALMAYEYRPLRQNDAVMIFTLQNSTMNLDTKYRQILDFLEKAIAGLNAADVAAALKFFGDYAAGGEIAANVADIRRICHSIVQISGFTFDTLPFMAATFPSPLYLEQIGAIETAEDYLNFLTVLKNALTGLIEQYLSLLNQKKPLTDNRQAALVSEITAFINANITDNQLSVLLIATNFDLSTAYISRIFKEVMKVTVLEYINDARIDLAKQLLVCSGQALDKIVKEIGYTDTSSFIRKFKKTVGMTPGEYRKNHI